MGETRGTRLRALKSKNHNPSWRAKTPPTSGPFQLEAPATGKKSEAGHSHTRRSPRALGSRPPACAPVGQCRAAVHCNRMRMATTAPGTPTCFCLRRPTEGLDGINRGTWLCGSLFWRGGPPRPKKDRPRSPSWWLSVRKNRVRDASPPCSTRFRACQAGPASNRLPGWRQMSWESRQAPHGARSSEKW